MKTGRWIIGTLMLVLVLAFGKVWAVDTRSVMVLPFATHSSENIDWIQQSVWDMISIRVSAGGNITVLAKDKVSDALKPKGVKQLSEADVYALGKQMKADYVVWGSISKIGNNLSIDGKLMDVGKYQSAFGASALCHGMDEVIPKINDFSQKVVDRIMGGAVAAAPAPAAPAPAAAAAAPAAAAPAVTPAARESEVIAGIRKSSKGTMTAAINPDFINAFQPVDRKGFWMSEGYPTEFRGMAVGDVNGDGLNEIVAIDRNSIRIFQKKGSDFRMIQKIQGKMSDNYIAVDVVDLFQDKRQEIVVTNLLKNNALESFVLEWKNGKFVELATRLPWFFRAIETPGGVKLMGQRFGVDRPFSTPIYEMVWEGGKLKEGKKMTVPLGLSVYNFTIDAIEAGGPERIIALDDYDYLCIYTPTDMVIDKLRVFGGPKELLYKSDEIFGGSNLYVDYVGQETTGGGDGGPAGLHERPDSDIRHERGREEGDHHREEHLPGRQLPEEGPDLHVQRDLQHGMGRSGPGGELADAEDQRLRGGLPVQGRGQRRGEGDRDGARSLDGPGFRGEERLRGLQDVRPPAGADAQAAIDIQKDTE